MKVIFLDIDGVLQCGSFTKLLQKLSIELMPRTKLTQHLALAEDNYGVLFCPYSVGTLSRIILSTKAKIVISSMWRVSGRNGGGEDFCKRMWKDRNLPGEVIDFTPILLEDRGVEIEAYLETYSSSIDSFLILDDDKSILPYHKKHWIQTEYELGLLPTHYERAVNILNNKFNENNNIITSIN